MKTDQIRDVYDRLAPTYDTTLGLAEKLVLGDLRRAFGSQLRGETLEIAIGTGLNLPYYSPAVTSATGVDLSAGMLKCAQRRAEELGRPIVVAQMDAEKLAFADARFDTVAISLALCTVPEPIKALREVARVCRPAGSVVLLEHVRSPNWPVYAGQRLWTPVQERIFGCSWVRETDRTVLEEGFHVLSERRRLFDMFRLVVAKPPARL